MPELDDSQILTLITGIVEQHGCRIIELDLDRQIINIEGPEDAKVQCAMAIGEILK